MITLTMNTHNQKIKMLFSFVELENA